jgi:transposase
MPNHLSTSERWRIVTLWFDCNLPLREIAFRLGCAPSTALDIIRLYEDTGDVVERLGRGRHLLINGSVLRDFHQIMSRHPTETSLSISNRLQSRSGVQVSASTIRRMRRREGYRAVHARIHWQINTRQAADRLAYCLAHRTSNWQRVIFTDEKKFVIDETGTVYWIRTGAPRPRAFISQVRYQVDVFAAVWHTGRSRMIFLRDRSNSSTYLRNLQLAIGRSLRHLNGYSLIHDRTTWSHTNMVHDWLNNNQITCMDDYPSVSPELNPIESVWGWMKHYVESHHPITQQHLEYLVNQAWQRIPLTIIQGYIRHIRTVVQQIIEADGWDVDG